VIFYVFDMEYFGQWYMFQYKNSQIIAVIQINCNNLDDNNEAVLFFDLFLFTFFFFFEAVGVGLFRLVGGRLG